MRDLKELIIESKELKIKNNPKLNTFDICNLIGDEYDLICQALSNMKSKESEELLNKIHDAEEPY